MQLSTVVLWLAAAHAAPTFDEGASEAPTQPDLWAPAPFDALTPDGIWNGTEVPPGEHPAVVAVVGQTGDGNLYLTCSGTLVTPDWVLTAAHCLQGMRSDIVVLFGTDLVQEGYTAAYPVVESHPHPDYDGDAFTNDIGLVRLAQPVTDVDPVVLNGDPITAEDHGEAVVLVGFGNDPADEGAGVKKETTVAIVAHSDQHIITNDPDSNLCQGDSGGPGFEQSDDGLQQIGVNAFVTPNCVDGSGGLTRVDTFVPWIRTLAPDVQIEVEQSWPTPDPDPDPDPRGPLVPDVEPDGFAPDADADADGEAGCHTRSGPAGALVALLALLSVRRRRS